MPVSYSTAVAAEVRAEMARQRISQRNLAEKAGWSARYLNYRLTGKAPLSTDDLEKIAGALDISLSALVVPRAV